MKRPAIEILRPTYDDDEIIEHLVQYIDHLEARLKHPDMAELAHELNTQDNASTGYPLCDPAPIVDIKKMARAKMWTMPYAQVIAERYDAVVRRFGADVGPRCAVISMATELIRLDAGLQAFYDDLIKMMDADL